MDIIAFAIGEGVWLGLLALVQIQRRSYWGLFGAVLQLTIDRELAVDNVIKYGSQTFAPDSTIWAVLVLLFFITLVWTMKEGKKTK